MDEINEGELAKLLKWVVCSGHDRGEAAGRLLNKTSCHSQHKC